MRRVFSRQILLVASLVACLFCTVVYTACIKTNCGTTACFNGGVCVSGTCSCPSGYEGAHCDKPWTAKFAGTWNNTEIIQDSAGLHNVTYQLAVRADTVATQFVIDSLEGIHNGIHCVQFTVNTFSIPPQSTSDSTFYISGGNGTLDSTGTVKIIYNFTENQLPRSAQMTWTR